MDLPITTATIIKQINEFVQRNATEPTQQRAKDQIKAHQFLYGFVEGANVEVHIKGTYKYVVKFTLDVNSKQLITKNSCTCPYSLDGICKHQVATLHWLRENNHLIDIKHFTNNLEVLQYKIDNLKIKAKTISETRSSSALFSVTAVYLTSQNSFLTFLSGSVKNNRLLLAGYKVEEQTEEHFTISASFTNPDHWNNSLLYETITLHLKSHDINVSCSCNHPVKTVCGHVYALLMNFISQNKIDSLKPISPAEKEDLGTQALIEYGLNSNESWENYFNYVLQDSGRVMVPKDAYAKLFSARTFNKNFRKLAFSSEDFILTAKNKKHNKNLYNVGFLFQFVGYDDSLILTPIGAKKGKNNLPMEVSFIQLSHYHDPRNVNFISGTKELLNLANHFSGEGQYRDKDELNDLEQLRYCAEMLANYPYLYTSKIFQRFSIKKAKLEPIKFVFHAPEIVYQLTEQKQIIKLSFIIKHNDLEISLKHKSVKRPHKYFIQIDDTLYLVPTQHESHHFEIITELAGKQFTLPVFKDFFDLYLSEALKKYPLKADKLKSINMEKNQLEAVSKELYLSEADNFVVLRPFLRHNGDVLVNVLSDAAAWTLEENTLREQTIDKDAALNFLAEIKQLHPQFETQNRDDILYLSYEEMQSNKYFFKMFKQLQENNIKVFGLEKLKKLAISPYQAQVKYQVASGIDWFEVNTEISFGDQTIDLSQLKKRFIPGNEYVELGDGTQGVLPEEWLKKLEKLFRHGEEIDGKFIISKKMFSLVDELFDAIDDQEAAAYILDKKNKLLNFDKIQKHQLPSGINAQLRHYQEDGFQWLCFLDEFQWGGILADDMGLGKTLQIITFFKHILQTNPQTNLVVVPTSLLFNWQNEIDKFAPTLKTFMHYGIDRKQDTAHFDDYDIVFTSYGIMLSDIEMLKDYNFNYVVLDESQTIKNAASKRFKAAKLLLANNKIAMTGTPIENNTFDLFAQMSFLNPGLLGTAASFKKDFATAIDKNRDSDRASDLQKLIKPFVLRRTKEQVATELPDKIEDILYCEMGKSQQKVYDAIRNDYRNKVASKMETEGINKARFSVLEGLTKLRQVCDCPEILPGDEKYTDQSAKIDVLLEHIKEKTAQHKILVFSQFVKMLKLIENQLQKEGISYAYLDGQSTMLARQKSVEHFQEDKTCRVFLISLKAGGTGLNLVAADYVYLVDPWWNPAVENQAIDRCYRIGQDKKVIAYRMICKNTVEDKIIELQKKKKAIAGDIITTDESVLKQLDKNDILDLFG